MKANKDKGTSVGFTNGYISYFKGWGGNEQIVSLTKEQVWFIKVAIEARQAVLPLNPIQLDDETFATDYGITKNKIQKEINSLKSKLNSL